MKFPLLCLFVISTLAICPAGAQEAAPKLLDILSRTLEQTSDPSAQANILRGMNAALKGKRGVSPPSGWAALYEKLKGSPDEQVRREAQALAVVLGASGAMEELRKALLDKGASEAARKSALDSLVSAKDPQALPALLMLVREAGSLRGPALRGLAVYNEPQVATAILEAYPTFDSGEKRDALGALTGRLEWAKALVGAIDAKRIPGADLSAPLVRQLQAFGDSGISSALTKHWGAMRAVTADKQDAIARYKASLTVASLQSADASHGRALYSMTCASCHTLFGVGGRIGPELPGAFDDIDYLLQNIVDPNAIIGKDYQQTNLRTKDGQVLAGVLSGEDAASITLTTLAGPLTVQRQDVAEVTLSDVSLMPEGLLSTMTEAGVRDLFSYLGRHGQVPMLVTPLTANDFFNGVDLARWIPSAPTAWQVADGQIAGKGNAERPEFLISDMVARDFTFKANVRVTGPDAIGEIAFAGQQQDGGFAGYAVNMGASGPVTVWEYRPPAAPRQVSAADSAPSDGWSALEVRQNGADVELMVQGKSIFKQKVVAAQKGTVFAFHVFGPGAGLMLSGIELKPLTQ